jgi:hypothetical protein
MNKENAARHIAQRAKQSLAPDRRARFIEITETELGGLHEGNIARFRIRPSEFRSWKAAW